ncbi:MAG: 3-hydroxyacyl-CoA dehydrogenase NAD-binding domain-containing protein [Pseudomonadota bacterium]
MQVVEIERQGEVALISLNYPPVNAMSNALRQGLVAALAELDADDSVKAIALYGKGRGFCAGADITEFGRAPEDPLPPAVTLAIEDTKTPVVAVIHGNALGGGLEMGLAAHARVATPDSRLGVPEVNIGLLPGAGGCTRLPRIIGWDAAIEMITIGRPKKAAEAEAIGLVDRVVAGDVAEVALAAAQDLAAGKLEARMTSAMPIEPDEALLAEWKAKLTKKNPHLVAPQKALEAIGNTLLPRDEALAKEQVLFFECMKDPQSAALIHAFDAERAVWKIPEASATPRDVKTVGVIGGGTMGSGIATAMLLSGYAVTLVEMSDEAAARATATITKNLGGAVKRGKLTEEALTAMLSDAFTATTGFESFADTDVIIEAVFENMDLKKKIFAELDTIAKPGAILASNTSGLDLNEIAAATSRPTDVVGLHFFSPAHVMRLLEVVVHDTTAPEVTATGFAMAKTLRKIPVRAGVCDGFIGNRILFHYLDAVDKLVLRGAAPEAVDRAMERFGFALGPLAVNDLAGLDIGIATRTKPGKSPASGLEKRMVDAGWLGRKNGTGYYVYGEGRPVPNPDLAPHLDAERAAHGITPTAVSDKEIVDIILTAMIVEAVGVLEEGIALRPVDIDAVYLFGYGFPRFRGGPMHYADTVGAAALVERIEAYAKADPDYWKVPALLRQMAADGTTFVKLNRA